MSLKPFRHAHSSDKEHQANNQEQEKEKFRNSRRSRGNPGKSKERSYQRNHQKNNSPTQHNDPPPFLIRPSPRCCAHVVEGRAPASPVRAGLAVPASQELRPPALEITPTTSRFRESVSAREK